MKKLALLALTALLAAACCQEKTLELTVTNDLGFDRQAETLEFCLETLQEALGMSAEDTAVIVLGPDGQQVPTQVLHHSCHCLKFIFQADVPANSSVTYTLKKGSPEAFPCQAKATFMPRRKDDISWENNKTIFRMYGPALVTDPVEGMVSGGLDLWVKRTEEMVSQKWYQDEFDGKSSYHHDNGEGLDFYSVGTTLGAGAMAPFIDGKLWTVGSNFKSYEILENGPIRTMFRLNYDAYDVNGRQVSESRLITLDAGSYLNRTVILYQGFDAPVTVAAGFPFRGFTEPAKLKRGQKDTRTIADCKDIIFNKDAGYIAYGEPEHAENGIIFLGSLMLTPVTDMLLAGGHVLNCTLLDPERAMMYYSGGAWSKGGFADLNEWADYLDRYAQRLASPLKVCAGNCCEKGHDEAEGCQHHGDGHHCGE